MYLPSTPPNWSADVGVDEHIYLRNLPCDSNLLSSSPFPPSILASCQCSRKYKDHHIYLLSSSTYYHAPAMVWDMVSALRDVIFYINNQWKLLDEIQSSAIVWHRLQDYEIWRRTNLRFPLTFTKLSSHLRILGPDGISCQKDNYALTFHLCLWTKTAKGKSNRSYFMKHTWKLQMS